MKVYLGMDNIGLSEKPKGWQIAAVKKRASEGWQNIELKKQPT